MPSMNYIVCEPYSMISYVISGTFPLFNEHGNVDYKNDCLLSRKVEGHLKTPSWGSLNVYVSLSSSKCEHCRNTLSTQLSGSK